MSEVARLTGFSDETVRRYFAGHPPSTKFLAEVCQRWGVNGHWLLTGEGSMYNREAKAAQLKSASSTELLVALAEQFDRSALRLGELEMQIRSLEELVKSAVPARIKARPIGERALTTGEGSRQAEGGPKLQR